MSSRSKCPQRSGIASPSHQRIRWTGDAQRHLGYGHRVEFPALALEVLCLFPREAFLHTKIRISFPQNYLLRGTYVVEPPVLLLQEWQDVRRDRRLERSLPVLADLHRISL